MKQWQQDMYKIIFPVNNLWQEGEIMKGLWEEEEVKTLLNEVKGCCKKGLSLKDAFYLHAQKFGRKPNSVRNYYYHEISLLEKDFMRAEKVGFDKENHKISEIKFFSQEQESELIKKIDSLVEEGFSVRRACLTLANNDASKMLRYQNKYRNFKSKQNFENSKTKSENVKQTQNETNIKTQTKQEETQNQPNKLNLKEEINFENLIEKSNVQKINQNKNDVKKEQQDLSLYSQNENSCPQKQDNIVQFVKNPPLTDSDIQSLFMGLVRLVKRNALQKTKEEMGQTLLQANRQLRQSIVLLAGKEKKLKNLEKEFKKIKQENAYLKMRNIENQIKEK